MDYSQKTFIELARIFEDKHGTSITPEALRYRVKKGLSKEEAVMKPLSARGKTSRKKRLRVGRKSRRHKVSGLRYVYLHIDVPGNNSPLRVRYVGIGEGGRMLNFHGREKSHQDWIKAWFTSGQAQDIEVGVAPSKLKDLSWIDLSIRQSIIITSCPFEGAAQEEARLVHHFNSLGHPLFNRYLFSTDIRSISKGFQCRTPRKKVA